MALQRLVELTAPRVVNLRTLNAQYRLVRKLGSGSYGRVLLARPRAGGESPFLGRMGLGFLGSGGSPGKGECVPVVAQQGWSTKSLS